MMKLNCDVGEGLDSIDMGLLAIVDQASIACGGHAGDERSMKQTLSTAHNRGVTIGAHPSYPDKVNFGRNSLNLASNELYDALHRQITSLITIADYLRARVEFIKPHGALYHDAMSHFGTFKVMISIAKAFRLPLMLQAIVDSNLEYQDELASQSSVSIWREAFADRAYTDEGRLVPRHHAGAVLEDPEKIAAQVSDLAWKKGCYSQSGKWLNIDADSLCIHSDTQDAIAHGQAIADLLRGETIPA